MFDLQSKGDLRTAEDFYMRAILADPEDGEIMSLYAKLVWELHHDKDKALCYFERSVQAAPGDRYNFHAEFLISLLKLWKVFIMFKRRCFSIDSTCFTNSTSIMILQDQTLN
jgi:tetratricopeptide (TPR) repeat protein